MLTLYALPIVLADAATTPPARLEGAAGEIALGLAALHGTYRSLGIDSTTVDCHDGVMSPDGTYTICELADLADVTTRTIRYYVSQGLLASPARRRPERPLR